MAKFLLACWPFAGHISPFMSLALALGERGHDVAFYTGSTAQPLVEASGFTCFPFERVSEARATKSMISMDTAAPSGRPEAGNVLQIFRDWLVETIPDQLADLEPIIADWRPDVIVSETAMWGPILVLSESGRTPVAIMSTLLGCLTPGADAPPAGFGMAPPRTAGARLVAGAINGMTEIAGRRLRARVNEIRANYGLPALDTSMNRFTGRLPLYLIGSLPELDYNRKDLPASVHYLGPMVWHPPAISTDPEWLGTIPTERPWVHVTESTLSYGDPFVLRAAAQGLAGLPMEVILTSGRQRSIADLNLGDLAQNIHTADWINHDTLLPRCAAMVTTGGAGTLMSALRAGVPLVVVPTTWDKPDNARRIVDAGVGIRLPAKRCTPAGLRAAVGEVISKPRYRANALSLAQRLAAAPGPAHAAELLEELAPASVTMAN